MRYSICVDMLFSDENFVKRIDIAKKCDVQAIEFWKWSNKNIDEIHTKIIEDGLKVSVFNIDSSIPRLSDDLSHGILNSGRKDDFVYALKESIPIYKKLAASAMIVLVGERLDLPYEIQIKNIIEVLKGAAVIAEKENINLVVEPLNDYDRKNYFLPRAYEIAEIIREVNSPNIKLLLDLYHEQLMAGNLINTIIRNIDIIGHVHIADVPGRHEPGSGEINYINILNILKKFNYKNYVGFEFRPTHAADETINNIRGLVL